MPGTPCLLSDASLTQPAFATINTTAALDQASRPQPTGCLDSTEILRGQKTVEINHNGLTYRLQATRLGKLILTK